MRRLQRGFATCALLASSLGLAACSTDDDDDPVDGEDDTFVSDDGKTDVAGIAEKTPEACAVLRLAREASFDVLDDDVRLNRLAVHAIVGARANRFIHSLSDLDRIKHVGPAAFRRMLDYTRGAPAWACGTQSVQLLATNDFHGNLKPPSGSSGRIQTGPDPLVNRVDAGGAEYLATHVAALRATNPQTVVVAAGDVIGATPLMSALFHDEPTVESMNAIGLQIASVGNHEFDEGPAELLRMAYGGCHPTDGCQDGDGFEGASYGYLAANVTDVETGETLFPAYEIRTFRAARVAFIGMTLEGTPSIVTPAGVAGLAFHDEIATVNELVPELKRKGIETIVVLLHEGGFTTGLYNECAGISGPLFDIVRGFDAEVDVVVAGHTNAAHVCDIDGKLVTSAASFGRLVTDIDLTIDEVTGEVTTKAGRNVIVTRDVARDAAQTTLIAKYDALAAPFANRIIGRISGDLAKLPNLAGESTMGNVIADAQLEATSAADRGASVIALMNPGGIRADLLAAQISGGEQAGEVTYGEAFTVQPFSNALVSMTLTGAQLDAVLEQQWRLSGGAELALVLSTSRGFTYTWDSTRAIGDRVSELRLGGVAVSPAASFRVTMNGFLADGGDGFTVLKQGTQRLGGDVDVDALTAYLAAHSPLAPPALDRITRR
ncbi:MAG TPA: bifunctional metallophosphatase/5'-nucleotidase [Kofleriaceae bacterium]|nr:bifunctional metallophosphatase/5'-nucleotidase [Kofleriaceae bacterium]